MILGLFQTMAAMALSAPISIPFTRTPEGLVTIPAIVGDSIPTHLVFDTGAGTDVIAPSILRRLHAEPAGQLSPFRMWGDRVDIPLFTIDQMSVGGRVEKNVVVGSWDVLDTVHIDGIVSLNDFRHQPVTFAFPKQVIVLESPRSLAARGASGVTIPVRSDDTRSIAIDLFAEFRMGSDSGLCDLDTSSPSATLHSRYLAPLGVDTTDSTIRRQNSKNAGGASGVRYTTAIPGWSLATSPQSRPPVRA